MSGDTHRIFPSSNGPLLAGLPSMVTLEVGVMFWIQVAAAVLLIIRSALIFQYLYLADRYDARDAICDVG